MRGQFKTTETEIIVGEDWCTHCEKDVNAWNVVFETDSEGEYVKLRRCPHCGEKCFADSYTPLAFMFFLIGFACSFLWLALLPSLGIATDLEKHLWVILASGGLHGVIVATLGVNFWKQRLFDRRKSNPYG